MKDERTTDERKKSGFSFLLFKSFKIRSDGVIV